MEFDLETKEDGKLWVAGYMYPGYHGSSLEPPEDSQFEWIEIRQYAPDKCRTFRLMNRDVARLASTYAVEIQQRAFDEYEGV